MGVTPEIQEQVKEKLASVKINMNEDLTASFTLSNGWRFDVKPLSRKYGKKFMKALNAMRTRKEGSGADKLEGYLDYDPIMEECLLSSITLITIPGIVEVSNFDVMLDDMPEPDYDMLVIHFQSYYGDYKKNR